VLLLGLGGFLGRWHWLLDLPSAFRPHYAALLAILGPAAWWAGRRVVASAFVAGAALNAAILAPLWLVTPAPPAGAGRLQVHSHNVHGGGDERFAQVVEDLRHSDADLVFLYEMSPRWIELFASTDLPFKVVHPTTPSEHRRIMALSRVPVSSARAVPLTSQSTGGISVDVDLGDRPVSVLGLHTLAPRSKASAALRDRELAAAGRWARRQKLPVVIVGDLNATSGSSAFKSVERSADLIDSQRGFGLQPTWMAGYGPFRVPIDHLLHSPQLTTTDRDTGPSLGSAHLSLQVDLAWADRAD
jgi:endonuclease/exonuclease/phosphatase (EEP) superfamily protein YafD